MILYRYTYTYTYKYMPNRTIYIRIDDIEKWDSIESVPDFIHDALYGLNTTIHKKLEVSPINVSGLAGGSVKSPDPVLGYPCCSGKRRCKHWQWEPGQEAYVNTLTGDVREAEL